MCVCVCVCVFVYIYILYIYIYIYMYIKGEMTDDHTERGVEKMLPNPNEMIF